MDNEKIVAKARLAADFMSNLFEDIETREDLIMSLELERFFKRKHVRARVCLGRRRQAVVSGAWTFSERTAAFIRHNKRRY